MRLSALRLPLCLAGGKRFRAASGKARMQARRESAPIVHANVLPNNVLLMKDAQDAGKVLGQTLAAAAFPLGVNVRLGASISKIESAEKIVTLKKRSEQILLASKRRTKTSNGSQSKGHTDASSLTHPVRFGNEESGIWLRDVPGGDLPGGDWAAL